VLGALVVSVTGWFASSFVVIRDASSGFAASK